MLFGPAAVHDVDRGQLVGQDRVRPVGFQDDGHRVDDLDRGHALHLLLPVRGRRQRALEGELHVLGGEILAAMELHALAQGELPAALDGLPGGGELGLKLQLGVAGDEAFIDLARHRDGRAFVLRMRIHGQGVALAGPSEGLGRSRGRDEREYGERYPPASELGHGTSPVGHFLAGRIWGRAFMGADRQTVDARVAPGQDVESGAAAAGRFSREREPRRGDFIQH